MVNFRVVKSTTLPRTDPDVIYLVKTNWDDWYSFSTLFQVEYVDSTGESRFIGTTKIGQFGLKPAPKSPTPPEGSRSPQPPETFSELGDKFFSLGQDSSFYETLTEVGESFREQVLQALNDIAFDPDLLLRAEEEEVTRVSLLRDVPLMTVREQFARLARGGVRLTPFNLRFRLEPDDASRSVQFKVIPDSSPPTNIHVLIGRNGVGKSTFLHRLAERAVQKVAQATSAQTADDEKVRDAKPPFPISNIVSVSFSAFDVFEPISVPRDRTGLTYHYVGLKKVGAKTDDPEALKNSRALASEMTKSARLCLLGARKNRWLRALSLLESDPIFAAAGIAASIEEGEPESALEHIRNAFRRLSSGHKIVLLTVTKLVETVSEKSLVLIDEPEAHLHPPLLSAFVRALSDLLVNQNGMAIIATHSPVILQEVPRSCVWKMSRSGDSQRIERPAIETFGENVGTLTSEVFGLEVTATGFHRLLWESAQAHDTYEGALASFEGQLGAEARAVLRAIVAAYGSAGHVGS